jgi:hypothetical protein
MIANVHDYWNSIVKPNMEAYERHCTEQTVWNYSVSLFHLTDWLADGDEDRHKALINELTAKCSDIKLLKDICNSRKHFKLERGKPIVSKADQVKVSAPDYQYCWAGWPLTATYGVVKTIEGKHSLTEILNNCRDILYTYVTGPL